MSISLEQDVRTLLPLYYYIYSIIIHYNVFYLIYTYTYLSTCIAWPASGSAITILRIFNYVIISAQALITAK